MLEQGGKTIHMLFSTLGFQGRSYAKTDIIVSFAPFNRLPTHCFLSIDGGRKWFGQ